MTIQMVQTLSAASTTYTTSEVPEAAAGDFSKTLAQKLGTVSTTTTTAAGETGEAIEIPPELAAELEAVIGEFQETLADVDSATMDDVLKTLQDLLVKAAEGGEDEDFRAAAVYIADMLAGLIGAVTVTDVERKPAVQAAISSAEMSMDSLGENSENALSTGIDAEVAGQNPDVRKNRESKTDNAFDIGSDGNADTAEPIDMDGFANATAKAAETANQPAEAVLTNDHQSVQPLLANLSETESTANLQSEVTQAASTLSETDVNAPAQNITVTGEAPEITFAEAAAAAVDAGTAVAQQTLPQPEEMKPIFANMSVQMDKEQVAQTAQELYDKLVTVVTEYGDFAEQNGNAAEDSGYGGIFEEMRMTSAPKLVEKPQDLEQVLAALKGTKANDDADKPAAETAANAIPMQQNVYETRTIEPTAIPQNDSAVATPTEQLSDQILAKLTELGDGKVEFEMILNPEELGKITVKLVAEGDKVAVEIIAERPETATLLQNRAENLQLTLKENGVNLSGYQVEAEQAQQEQDAQNNNRQSGQEQQQSQSEEEQSESDFVDFLQSLTEM